MSTANLHHAIESFSTWLRVERNLAPRTRQAYLYDLKRFSEWMLETKSSEQVALKSIHDSDLKDYLEYLRQQLGIQTSTLNRIMASLGGFFKYCTRENMIETNPLGKVNRGRTPQKIPVYLVRDELKTLLNSPDQTTYKGIRDLAIMMTLAFAGLRVSELIGLNCEHIDWSRKTLRVFGKGRKERLVPVHEELEKALWNYLEHDERKPAPKEKSLFLNQRGNRLSARAVQYIVNEYVEKSGISKDHISPHKLRHTFATLLHSEDVDLIDIQALMGHASLVSTQIYTHTDTRRLKETVELLDYDLSDSE